MVSSKVWKIFFKQSHKHQYNSQILVQNGITLTHRISRFVNFTKRRLFQTLWMDCAHKIYLSCIFFPPLIIFKREMIS